MVPMSTPAVLAETQEASARLGLSLRMLEADFDVDLPEDLPRLAARLEQDAVLRRGATAHILRRRQPLLRQRSAPVKSVLGDSHDSRGRADPGCAMDQAARTTRSEARH
jgi:hypothetical protein